MKVTLRAWVVAWRRSFARCDREVVAEVLLAGRGLGVQLGLLGDGGVFLGDRFAQAALLAKS